MIYHTEMKKIFALVLVLGFICHSFTSCNKYETYADKKKKESSAISSYIAKNNIKVISEEVFAAQGNKTNVSKNEFVLFESNGIYLQIIREGAGKKIKNGETAEVVCRFSEYNLLGDSLQLSNDNLYFSSLPDIFTVTNTSGTFSGSFNTSSSLMYSAYGTASVPSGWLFPLTYLNIGRMVNDDDETAKVKVIVPSSQGQRMASSSIYPCLYTITYQRGNK